MEALRRIVPWLLPIKTMDSRLTSFRACWSYQYQLSLVLLLWPWWLGPCVVWRSPVVVGWSPSILAHILRHVLLLPVLPSVGVVIVVAIIVKTVAIIPFIVSMATIIIVPAIVISPGIVVTVPAVLIEVIVIFRIAVVVLVLVSGPWPVIVPVSWSVACLGLG